MLSTGFHFIFKPFYCKNWDYNSVVKYLPDMHKILGLVPNTTNINSKKKKRKKKCCEASPQCILHTSE